MKTNPVRPFRLPIVLLIPVAIVLVILSFSLTNANLVPYQQQFNHQNLTSTTNILQPYPFTKEDNLLVDADGDGFVTPGDTIQYALSFSNTGNHDISNLTFTDTLDVYAIYLTETLIVSPLAFADFYTTTTNTILDVPHSGVLSNDELFGSSTTISSYTATTHAGGVVIVEENGRFVYTPPPNFVGQDSFTYTLENEAGKDSASVKIVVVDSDISITKIMQITRRLLQEIPSPTMCKHEMKGPPCSQRS